MKYIFALKFIFLLFTKTESAILQSTPGSKHAIDVLITNTAGNIFVLLCRMSGHIVIFSCNHIYKYTNNFLFWTDVGKPDAHLFISYGEDFPSTDITQSERGGTPSGIPTVQKIEPNGFVLLSSNTTLTARVWLLYKNRQYEIQNRYKTSITWLVKMYDPLPILAIYGYTNLYRRA